MGPRRWRWRRPFLLALAAAVLGSCAAGSSRFFRTMYTALSEPSQGLPHFTAVAFLDEQPIGRYDSETRRLRPQIPWLQQLDAEDPEYCDRYSRMAQNDEKDFRGDLVYLRNRYNQSRGYIAERIKTQRLKQ